MPGLVAFRRRWSIGSDDLAVPGAFFFLLHAIWLTVLSVALAVSDLSSEVPCQSQLWEYILGYLIILSGCLLLEACIVGVSMRGSILETAPREATQYLIYIRLGVMVVEMAWLVVGVIWLVKYYHSCQAPTAKEALIGAVICNWISVTSAFIMVWCTFDPAGRSWVKMKNYQRTMKDGQKKYQYKRSGSHHRNWRQRKVLRAYRDSWDNRCRMLFCCMDRSDRNQNSFADIAQLLSEFFRDLDVVPSDIIAGLVLLRRVQKLERNNIVKSNSNDTYEFLSGVKVTPASTFLALNQPDQLAFFKDVIHYMRLAMSIYGWPVFMMQHSSTGCCRLCPYLKGGCRRPATTAEVVEDNCCLCNTAATQRMAPLDELELVYVTYHVDVGETPFMVAVDHQRCTVIVCIRGTMSTKDVVTDLECEGEPIPTTPLRDDWLGHRGMVQTAHYIRDKLASERLLERAFSRAAAGAGAGAASYRLVLVGHSLGAGTAAILAILLRDQYPELRCFAYSPPGGLLSMPAVEYTKEFITSVVVGKDVVPRIGLHQLEQLRSDLMDVIKHSKQSKWRVIGGGMSCCGCCCSEEEASSAACGDLVQRRLAGRQLSAAHPSDSTIALTVHQPLYPPGRVMHIVRHHPEHHGGDKKVRRGEPVYQAIWVENDSFDEVLISPVMIQDHMPDKVLQALQKVLSCVGPAKPVRSGASHLRGASEERRPLVSSPLLAAAPAAAAAPATVSQHRLQLETSFDCEFAPPPPPPPPFEDTVSVSTLQLVWTGRRPCPPTPPISGLPGRAGQPAPLASPDTVSEASSSGGGSLLREVLRAAALPRRRPLSVISQSPGADEPSGSGGGGDGGWSEATTPEEPRDTLLPLEAVPPGGKQRPPQPSGDSGFVNGGSSASEPWFVTPRTSGAAHFVFPGEPGADCEVFLPGETPGRPAPSAV
ncbi:diacylglycerol lipase-alpha-like [Amphibalanus amphitrite]|uniref:diacylglycerol lipase-alpha-like n=1 Tax=Amphibalanus amphitrite TaxID=1232801 RepID=UPI001C92AC14|nr:diacylglycerol lipase-alpha-like [Amphibalanus amphitrite]